MLAMYPLTFIKKINSLNILGSLSVFFVLVSVIFVVVQLVMWLNTGMLNGIVHPKPKFALFPKDLK